MSKYPLKTFLRFDESVFVIIQFFAPNLSRFSPKAFILVGFISFDTNSPLLFNFDNIYVDFPPGAAHKSSTLSPSSIFNFGTTLIAEGSCK